ncbi:DUF3618 domain-containing protein [Streptomyces ziwulingensis]|uniref:DUF3618 domain-containing protein n=1 Tax=Streptomyces ziwulingensis TaxID=1045501 RepID=A0ABP9D9A2_9ACTN
MTEPRSGDSDTATGADGPDELRRQIERTRGRLGHTVEERADEAEVRGRAKARAADLGDRAGAMTVQLRGTAAQAGPAVQDAVGPAGRGTQDRAVRAGHAVEHRTPDPVLDAVRARREAPRPVLAAAAVAGAVAGAAVVSGVLRHRRAHR